MSDDIPYVGKAKTKFHLRFNYYKVNNDVFEKKKRMHHKNVFIYTFYKIAKSELMIGKSLYLRGLKHTKT